MKNILPALVLVMLSFSVNAQDAKAKVIAKPSEQNEIYADNRLKKSLQQKQLSAKPERIADTSSMQLNARKDVNRKKGKCCVKKTAKA